MNTSSVVLWLAEAPWGYSLTGRSTALLIVAWLAHLALAKRDPRWRVLVWRSAAVGLATIVVLAAAPPIVSWRLPRAESIAAQASSGKSVVPAADPSPVMEKRPAQVVDLQTPTPTVRRPSETAQRSSGGAAGPSTKAVITWLNLGACLLAIWLLGVAVMALRLGLCVWRVSGIVRRSEEVPPAVIEECRIVADALGCRQGVRVVQTAEVPAPCLTGFFHSWLLLPEANCGETNRADLRAILAHEFAHSRRHDLVWNVVLHCWLILLWFHPLVWRVRAAHLAACDAVCDAVAADLVGDVASYGRTLARLALQVAGPRPVPGLAMARTPDVFLRVEALKRRVFRGALPWRLIAPALLALGAVVVLIGGSGISGSDEPPARKDQPPARKATETEPRVANAAPDKGATKPASSHRLSLRVLSAKTDEPLEQVSVSCDIRGEGETRKETVTTGKDGTASIEWPPGMPMRFVGLDVKKPGYVGLFLYWDNRNHAISLPESHEARLEPGVPISGVVQDEAGKPVAQATVTARGTSTQGEEPHYSYEMGTTKTDEQGRWRIDDAPANVSGVSLHVEHPDYRSDPGATGGGREWRTILSKGTTVKGRVVDGSGKPVKGALVDSGPGEFRGRRKPTATDLLGEYTVRHCDAGPAIVTVQAEGFAPEVVEVTLPNQGEVEAPVIRLGEANTLRIKVVDRSSKPLAGAYLGVDTWRGHRLSLRVRAQTDAAGHFTWNAQTDAAGRFAWTSAPSDNLLFDIWKDGYMRRRLIPLEASNTEHVVTLDPELVISGSVTDAVSGKPVPRFQVIHGLELEGSKGITWWRSGAVEYTGGRYSMKFDMPSKETYVRIEAPGYEPAESRAFRSDEGAMIQDFRLKPAEGISGVVLLPDGKPAAGVQIVVGTQENRAFVRGGIVQDNSNAAKTTTGPDGRLTLPKHEGSFLLVVAADAGFGDATSDEFAKTGKLQLQPWGRIEGRVRIGRQPAAHQGVVYLPELPSNRGDAAYLRSYDYHFKTDSQGRFAIDRVIPGRGHIARVLDTTLRGEWSGREAVDVKPGQTAQVRVGGEGRAVIGRVVLDGTPEEPVDWRTNDPAVLETPRAERLKATARWISCASPFNENGRFRIEDVAPGAYELKIRVSLPSDRRTWGEPRAAMGEAILRVTVPEGPVDQAVDVGDIKTRLHVRVGDLAPDFTAPRLDGGQFKLSEQRGKLVLLDFWATWCGPCLAEMPSIKDIEQTFGNDPRFELVGLSCDDGIERPAEFVKANSLGWTQAFAGKMLEGEVAETYLIRAIPATYLIGPNGRVIAINLRGAALKEAVRKALSDEKLFSGGK
jgi:beta-lactamase regulating signal transducer with metallopeptidase domain/thiol-disulfide isomerase/thioredoxin/protocatechuate 3,4-dioxygenase beta subunit